MYPNPATTNWVPLGYNANILQNVPSCRLYHSASQTVPANQAQLSPIAYNGERWDTDNMHDTVTNNGRITIQTPGRYLIGCNGHLDTTTGTFFCQYMMYRGNDSALVALDRRAPMAGSGVGLQFQIHTIMDCAVGDWFYTSVATADTVTHILYGQATASFYPAEFWAHYLGPAISVPNNAAALASMVTPDPAWIAPTLLNSWANYGAGFMGVGYRKDMMGYVHLRGLISGGSPLTSNMFILPVGYRPAGYQQIIPAISNSVLGDLRISGPGAPTPGAVNMITGGSAGWVSFDSIVYLAEA
jgi:hypothetical protein